MTKLCGYSLRLLALIVLLTPLFSMLGCNNSQAPAKVTKSSTTKAQLEAEKFYLALCSDDWNTISPSFYPNPTLKDNRISRETLKAVFDNYIYPEFKKNGSEYTVGKEVRDVVNVLWVITTKDKRTGQAGFSWFIVKGETKTLVQNLMVDVFYMRALREVSKPDAAGQIRRDSAFLTKLGWTGFGNKDGKFGKDEWTTHQ